MKIQLLIYISLFQIEKSFGDIGFVLNAYDQRRCNSCGYNTYKYFVKNVIIVNLIVNAKIYIIR